MQCIFDGIEIETMGFVYMYKYRLSVPLFCHPSFKIIDYHVIKFLLKEQQYGLFQENL